MLEVLVFILVLIGLVAVGGLIESELLPTWATALLAVGLLFVGIVVF